MECVDASRSHGLWSPRGWLQAVVKVELGTALLFSPADQARGCTSPLKGKERFVAISHKG